MADQEGRRLWAEDVAQVLGVLPRTVIFSASKTKRKPLAQRTAVDMPLPDGRRRRVVQTTTGNDRTVVSPWWREDRIWACRDAREAAGLLNLDRAPGGRFAKAAG